MKKNKYFDFVYTKDMIKKLIFMHKGEFVMIDSFVALVYHCELETFNKIIRDNIDRFPEDFYYRINEEELLEISKQMHNCWIFLGEDKEYPYVFNEKGLMMLVTVFNDNKYVETNLNLLYAIEKKRNFE